MSEYVTNGQIIVTIDGVRHAVPAHAPVDTDGDTGRPCHLGLCSTLPSAVCEAVLNDRHAVTISPVYVMRAADVGKGLIVIRTVIRGADMDDPDWTGEADPDDISREWFECAPDLFDLEEGYTLPYLLARFTVDNGYTEDSCCPGAGAGDWACYYGEADYRTGDREEVTYHPQGLTDAECREYFQALADITAPARDY